MNFTRGARTYSCTIRAIKVIRAKQKAGLGIRKIASELGVGFGTVIRVIGHGGADEQTNRLKPGGNVSMRLPEHLFFSLILALAFVSPLAAVDRPEARAFRAMAAGDYATAHKILQPRADQGAPFAQALLGTLYKDGNGVPRDARKAIALFEQAADAGNCIGMGQLGWVHVEGVGAAQDFVAAYKWFNLAVAWGCDGFSGERDSIAKNMTREDIATAQRLARQWKLRIFRGE